MPLCMRNTLCHSLKLHVGNTRLSNSPRQTSKGQHLIISRTAKHVSVVALLAKNQPLYT